MGLDYLTVENRYWKRINITHTLDMLIVVRFSHSVMFQGDLTTDNAEDTLPQGYNTC
jgi:hypothetical protein